jgi:hypothetical protein
MVLIHIFTSFLGASKTGSLKTSPAKVEINKEECFFARERMYVCVCVCVCVCVDSFPSSALT